MNTFGASTTSRHTRNGAATVAALQPPHLPERFAAAGAADGAEQLLAKVRAARVSRCSVADYVRFAVVAVYLAGVMAWLLLSRQLRANFSIRRSLRGFLFRRRAPMPLTGIVPDGGYCYRAPVDPNLLSDAESVSRVQVYEDGVALPHAHCDHTVIRQHGRGGFSHWHGAIYFSTRDNTDPSSNGRRYVYREV